MFRRYIGHRALVAAAITRPAAFTPSAVSPITSTGGLILIAGRPGGLVTGRPDGLVAGGLEGLHDVG